MSSQILRRSTYRDVFSPGTVPRSGDVARLEARVDMDEFYRRAEQVHASSFHAWGVSSGLRVNVVVGSAGLHVLPGVAVDVYGRHISLAAAATSSETGEAEVGAAPSPDPAVRSATLVTVNATTGAPVPTAGASGQKYVTIEWWESFDIDAYNTALLYRYDHTPWIRLIDAAGYTDDGARLVLARVTLDATGKVTAIDADLRRAAGVPVQRVDLQKGAAVSSTSVDNVAYGAIAPLVATGGVSLSVPNAGDEIHLEHSGGAPFAKVVLGASSVVTRDAAGRETISLDTAGANLTVGASGAEGDILVKDAQNRLAVALDSATASVYVGTSGNAGRFLAKDGSGRNVVTVDGGLSRVTAGLAGAHAGGFVALDGQGGTSVNLDGAPGDVWFRGHLKDINNSYGGIGHAELKALIGHGPIDLHRHVTGSTTNAQFRWLFADNGTDFQEVDLGSKKQVHAFIVLAGMDPRSSFDRGDAFYAEIYQIDGSVTNWFIQGGDDLGPPGDDRNVHALEYVGPAQKIRFRLRSMQDATVWAIGMVFVEE